MSEDLKQPRPNEAARAFLDHKLDLLPEEGVMLDINGFVTTIPEDSRYTLTRDNTYRDLLPFLLIEERTHVMSHLYYDAHDNERHEQAALYDKLRIIPLPVEEYVKTMGLTEDQERQLLKERKDFDAVVEGDLAVPALFDALEKIASNQPLTRLQKLHMSDGYDAVVDILRVMMRHQPPENLEDRIDTAYDHMENAGVAMQKPDLSDPAQEQNAALAASFFDSTNRLLSTQYAQMHKQLKLTIKSISPDLGATLGFS